MVLAAVSVTLTQLRSFVAVVRRGSVRAAADELVVTQPSVSAAVAALARELGADLLERDGRGVRLTAAGAAFAPFARDVIGLLEEGRHAAREAARVEGARLRLAAVTTAAESFVPPLMRSFAAEHPEIDLTLHVANRAAVLAMVLDHRADVAITGRPPADGRIAAARVRPNPFVLITAPDDPLAGAAGPVALEDLAGRPWLLREPGSGTRTLNEEFLAAAGLSPQTLTLGSNGAIRQAARTGLGVSILSRDAAAVELDAGLLTVIDAAGLPPPGDWYAVRSAVGPARAVVEAFVKGWRTGVQDPELPRGGSPAR